MTICDRCGKPKVGAYDAGAKVFIGCHLCDECVMAFDEQAKQFVSPAHPVVTLYPRRRVPWSGIVLVACTILYLATVVFDKFYVR